MQWTEHWLILLVGITILPSLIGRLAALLLPIWWRSRSKVNGGDVAA